MAGNANRKAAEGGPRIRAVLPALGVTSPYPESERGLQEGKGELRHKHLCLGKKIYG